MKDTVFSSRSTFKINVAKQMNILILILPIIYPSPAIIENLILPLSPT